MVKEFLFLIRWNPDAENYIETTENFIPVKPSDSFRCPEFLNLLLKRLYIKRSNGKEIIMQALAEKSVNLRVPYSHNQNP